MQMVTLDSVQIGKVVTEGDPGTREVTSRLWTSAFRKVPVPEPVRLGMLGLDGDQVADTVHHGGRDKAVLCYANCHYSDWASEHPRLDFLPGGFGENLTIGGADEQTVCIGDRWEIGETLLEVSQPRQPCWKIARRWGVKSMTKDVAQTGRTGWYLRVIRGGMLSAGQPVKRVDRPHPIWTVSRANDVLFKRLTDPDAVSELAGLAALSDDWKKSIV